MDEDVDMDAPQISTLRDEETPPPQQKSASNARRAKVTKKTAPKTKVAEFPAWTRPRKEPLTEEEYDEAEEEEDQLIDDDDDDMMKPTPPAALLASRSGDASQKRKASSKRKPRKGEKRLAEEERKSREKIMQLGAPSLAPTMTWFEATPTEAQEDMHVDVGQTSSTHEPTETAVPKAASAKKAPLKRPKIIARVNLMAPEMYQYRKKPPLPILADDAGGLSEGHTGTAASSPVTAHFDQNTPEPEHIAVPTASAAPPTEEANLENIPLPLYPLPTKPFPVQPPTKISTGFAPVIPLDKSGKKVRHWRVANREIRGIAGGRWFARSWVGEKESEFAASVKGGEDKVVPRSSAISATPVSGKKSRASKAASSLVASAAPSRAGSAIPDAPPASSTIRAPTKMRTIVQLAPSEGGDSDMAVPAGS